MSSLHSLSYNATEVDTAAIGVTIGVRRVPADKLELSSEGLLEDLNNKSIAP